MGAPLGISNAAIRSVFLGNENQVTGTVDIRERNPVSTGIWTTIYSFNLVNQAYFGQSGLAVSVNTGSELSAFTDVTLKNCKLVININGNAV